MHYLIFTMLFDIFTLSANTKICTHDKTTFRCVKYISNYDGDTITVKIPGAHDLFGDNVSIRIAGIDTPEIKTKNNCEKQKGRSAKKLVANLLKNAKSIELRHAKRGKYFRIVADVIADGVSISSLLIKNKLAVPYDGGTKKRINWCSYNGSTPLKAKAKTKKSKLKKPFCGNGICNLKTDKKGRNYCVCKGRKGRANKSCCQP